MEYKSMSMTAQSQFYNAKQLDTSTRKRLALNSLSRPRSVTQLAQDNKVSRKFIYQQKDKALNAINDTFQVSSPN